MGAGNWSAQDQTLRLSWVKLLDYFFTPKTASFAALATRNLTTVLVGILIFCCVFGLKPVRAFLFCFTSLPKPGKTNSPFFLISLGERAERIEKYSSGFFVGSWWLRQVRFEVLSWSLKRIGRWSIARQAHRFNTSKMSISVNSVGDPPLSPPPPYSHSLPHSSGFGSRT